MQRVTISLDDDLASKFDAIVRDKAYASRSEAVRDLVRQLVDSDRIASQVGGACVASLSYVYSFQTRALAQRLMDLKHNHHELVTASTQMALDHETTFETVLLKGPTDAVRTLVNRIIAERGVRFGAVNFVGVEGNDDHADPAPHHHHGKNHLSPLPG